MRSQYLCHRATINVEDDWSVHTLVFANRPAEGFPNRPRKHTGHLASDQTGNPPGMWPFKRDNGLLDVAKTRHDGFGKHAACLIPAHIYVRDGDFYSTDGFVCHLQVEVRERDADVAERCKNVLLYPLEN